MRENINVLYDVAKELDAKYYMFSDHREVGYKTKSNMIVDSYFPYMYKGKMLGASGHACGNRDIAISPFVANILRVRQADTSELCEILGFSRTSIKSILGAVKKKKIRLVLAGYGGTGANFMHWMNELCEMSDRENIFEEMQIFDADNWSLSNLPRIPINMSDYSYGGRAKVSAIPNENIARYIYTNYNFLDKETIKYFKEDTVIYGAPTIEARGWLSEAECMFVSATHKDAVCSLDINPHQNAGLQVEGYGKIDLARFFMNHLMMTIQFLKFLGEADLKEIDISEKIMDYSFQPDEYKTRRRTYKFPKGVENV